jgi:pimeloyl-ACP methyl ester carboxylesterase
MRILDLQRNRIGLIMALLLGVAVVGVFGPSAAAKSNERQGRCIDVTLPVAASDGSSTIQKVHGTYCQPFRWAHGQHQVDVLTEGATYNASYWNWPVNPDLYAYVDKTLAQGRATFAYDRIGSGKSSHPVSTDITESTDAYVLHQLIELLHRIGYRTINSIGHSYGSGIALEEAATYQDISNLVLTGYLHRPSNPAVTAGNYPANQDPAFAGWGLDSGYLTTRPGARQTSFYSSEADPTVVAYDEAHKDLVSQKGLVDFITKRGITSGSNMSNRVTVPILLMTGMKDAIFCYDSATFDCTNTTAVIANEAPYYEHAASLQVEMIAGTGHDLALHPTANDSFAKINQWIQTH